MKFSVSTTNIRIFISVIWFVETLKNTNNHYLYLSECTHFDEDEHKILDFVSYDTDFIFEYNSESLKFNRTRFGKPIFINSRCEAGQYEELTIEFHSECNLNKEEKIKFMKEFFIKSKESYDENKKCKDVKDKMTLWSYSDGFWEDLKRINKRSFKTVILDENIKSEIKLSIDRYNDKDHKEKLKSFGINHKMNLILSGLPGTGKSSLMFAIASMLNKDIATIDFNNKELSDHGFIKAIKRLPRDCIIALEDIDALYYNRDKSRDNIVSFSCILNFLDGLFSKEDLVTIITTNHLEKLDKAIIRPMRIDKIIKFTHCSKYQFNTIFEKFFEDKKELMNSIWIIIKQKKFTTAMLQNWLIKFMYEPEELINNINYFEEIIETSSEKETNMYS